MADKAKTDEQQDDLNGGFGTGNGPLTPPIADGPLVEEGPVVELTLEGKISRGVDNWVNTHLRNNAFSRNTEAWNILQAALPNLPGAIIEEVE